MNDKRTIRFIANSNPKRKIKDTSPKGVRLHPKLIKLFFNAQEVGPVGSQKRISPEDVKGNKDV